MKGTKKMRQRARAKPVAQAPRDSPALPTFGSSRFLAPDGPWTVSGKVEIADTQVGRAGTPRIRRLLGNWACKVSLAVTSMHQILLSG